MGILGRGRLVAANLPCCLIGIKMAINLNDDDVLNFPGDVNSWSLSTNKVKAVLKEIENCFDHRDGGSLVVYLHRKGADCECLSINGGGWRKGKLKLKMEFEFIPDTPDSPLDDLRSDLNI